MPRALALLTLLLATACGGLPSQDESAEPSDHCYEAIPCECTFYAEDLSPLFTKTMTMSFCTRGQSGPDAASHACWEATHEWCHCNSCTP